jgi:hypothetical protein
MFGFISKHQDDEIKDDEGGWKCRNNARYEKSCFILARIKGKGTFGKLRVDVIITSKCKIDVQLHVIGALRGRIYSSYSFSNSALDGVSGSRFGRDFTTGGRTPGTHWTGGWVSPRAGPYTEVRGKIRCICPGSNPDRPVRSQTLYWLSYPAPNIEMHLTKLGVRIWSGFIWHDSKQ